MKRITMILMATLMLAVLVYAQSRTAVQPAASVPAAPSSTASKTQAAQKGTVAPLTATPQEAQKAIQRGILSRVAATANKSLKTYPSPSQIGKVADSKIRSTLERGRKLLETGKTATTWNATQLSGFASQVDQNLKEVEATAKALKNNGGTTPQEDCGAAKDRCNQKCHDNDGGYFCFVDCRWEYLACLIGSVGKASSGGVIMR
jgi:hypothetical protein